MTDPFPYLLQPLAEGESRQWEDWEYSYVPLMSLAFVLYGTAYYFRCARRASDTGDAVTAAAALSRAALLHTNLSCPARCRSCCSRSPQKNIAEWARAEALARAAADGEEEEE